MSARLLTTLLCAALALGGCEEDREPRCELPRGLPVFPGAEGFGTTTPAGRGGAVLEVTSLDDAGPGTLRAAVEASGPRTVVFRVGGTITLRSHLDIDAPFLTIAGQTAPGDGILLRGAGIVIFTHDVLIQHLRVRPGVDSPIAPDLNDAIAILGPHGDNHPGASNVVIDHVSASWGEDELVSIFYGARDVTVSWSILSEALDEARHAKGGHSSGLLVGAGASCVSVHHTLFAHNDFRNPLLKNGGRSDVVNNVIYDWGVLATELNPVARITEANLIANTYLAGPSSSNATREIVIEEDHPVHHLVDADLLFAPAGVVRLFAQGNVGPHRAAGDADEYALAALGFGDEPVPWARRWAAPHEAPAITTWSAAEAAPRVLAGAGATRPRRDPVDARVVSQVEARGGRIIDRASDVGGYPTMAGGEAPPDGDHDGMPDAWERARGMDPDDPGDGAADDDGDGYTNLEEWLHQAGLSAASAAGRGT